MSLFDLRDNLIEIWSINDLQRDLIPSGNERRVYKKGNFFSYSIQKFNHLHAKPPQLQNALNNIKICFWSQMDILEKAKNQFFSHLSRELKKETFNPNKKEAAKEKILQFCLHFQPFIKIVSKDREVKSGLVEFLCGQKDQAGESSLKTQLKTLFSAVQLCRKMANLEIVTETFLPLDLLLKISLEEELSTKEEKRIASWNEKIQASLQKKIQVIGGEPVQNPFVRQRSFHHFIVQLIGLFNESVTEKKADAALVEFFLIKQNNPCFENVDYKHLVWRNSLAPNQTLKIKDQTYQLGDVLYNPQKEPTLPMTFSVVDYPQFEISIDASESQAYLSDLEERYLHCGVKQAEILAVERCGRIILKERLHESLDTISWRSQGYLIGPQYDEPTARAIVKLIQGLITLPFTPFPLKSDSFAFNSEGKLRATKCLIPTKKNFEALEAFAYDCSRGNEARSNNAVFGHLMTVSGLSEVNEAKIYQELVKMAVENQEKQWAVTRNGSIINSEILNNRRSLYDHIQGVKEEVIATIKLLYEIDRFEKDLNGIICEAHVKFCPGSILIDTFVERVKLLFLEKFQPVLKKEYADLRISMIRKDFESSTLTAFKDKWSKSYNFNKIDIFNIKQMNAIYSQFINKPINCKK